MNEKIAVFKASKDEDRSIAVTSVPIRTLKVQKIRRSPKRRDLEEADRVVTKTVQSCEAEIVILEKFYLILACIVALKIKVQGRGTQRD